MEQKNRIYGTPGGDGTYMTNGKPVKKQGKRPLIRYPPGETPLHRGVNHIQK
jgi:hypothetical protein